MSDTTTANTNENVNQSPFTQHFKTYCDELSETFPEFSGKINHARGQDRAELMKFFSQALTGLQVETAESQPAPLAFLPGLPVSDDLWQSLSSNTKNAILEYMRVLGMCSFFEGGESSEAAQEHWQKFMGETMNNLDFGKLTGFFENFMKNFKTDETDGGGSDSSASGMPSGFPKLPERFLKGHLAKLAEELVRDISPEDIGLTSEMLKKLEESPARAFELLMEVFTRNPQMLQNTFQRIGKQLQQKVASGQIRPHEIAREAEELMKEFAENSDFVEMMEGLKGAFGMEDMDLARKAGKESSARLAAAKARLQKKKQAKDAAAGAAAAIATQASISSSATNTIVTPSIDEIVRQIESASNKPVKSSKKSAKK